MDKTWQDPRTTLNLTYFEQVIRDPRDRGNVCALDWSAEVVSEKPWGAMAQLEGAKSTDQWRRLWKFNRDYLDSIDSTDSIFHFHFIGLKIILKGHISRMTWWLLVVMTAVIQIWSVASWTCYINPLDGFVLEWFTGHSPNKNQQLI